jgi:hypothetical protein
MRRGMFTCIIKIKYHPDSTLARMLLNPRGKNGLEEVKKREKKYGRSFGNREGNTKYY